MNINQCSFVMEQTEVIEAVFSNRKIDVATNFPFQMNENPSIGQSTVFVSNIERINNSASNLLRVLEEISEFRQELVAEAQKRIR